MRSRCRSVKSCRSRSPRSVRPRYFARRGRARAAALCAAATMIEPHLGLPVCIALAIWMPATRLTLALALALLGALSVAALGWATNFEYFTGVLPAHALSEVTRDTQYQPHRSSRLAGRAMPPRSVPGRSGTWRCSPPARSSPGSLHARAPTTRWLVCRAAGIRRLRRNLHPYHADRRRASGCGVARELRERAGDVLAIAALVLLLVPWVWAISPALLVAPLFAGYLTWRCTDENLSAALIAALAVAAGGPWSGRSSPQTRLRRSRTYRSPRSTRA